MVHAAITAVVRVFALRVCAESCATQERQIAVERVPIFRQAPRIVGRVERLVQREKAV